MLILHKRDKNVVAAEEDLLSGIGHVPRGLDQICVKLEWTLLHADPSRACGSIK